MSPSMKVFRWLLSHLTSIIIVSIIIYFYWSWQGDEQTAPEETASQEREHNKKQDKQQAKQQSIKKSNTEQLTDTVSPQTVAKNDNCPENTTNNTISNTINNSAVNANPEYVTTETAQPVPDPQAFSERMRQYQLRLSREERERLSSYNKALHNNRTQVPGVKTEPVYPDERLLLNKVSYPNKADINTLSGSQPLTESGVKQSIQKPLLSVQPVIGSDQKQSVEHNLQDQIRFRQKQLSHQMISLLAVTTDTANEKTGINKQTRENKSKLSANKQRLNQETSNPSPVRLSIQKVVPEIITADQKKLLSEARKAFEQGQYRTAEQKYLRLAALLPDVPDVMGELANVYKHQKRFLDYVAANTRFVKRLVNHHRFKEAWRVVAETANIDKNAADKQRRIINKKQKQVETENFIP